jgi:hypothetical protein
MTSKIVIRDATNSHWSSKTSEAGKCFKVIKLTNYKNFKILGQLFTQLELKKFLETLPSRVNYEILGEQ